jgi:hypothetical protein
LSRLRLEILWEIPGFWVDYYFHFVQALEESGHGPLSEPLQRRGRMAMDRQDMNELRQVVRELSIMLPRDVRVERGLPDIGLRV